MASSGNYVALSSRRFRKQLLRYGEWKHSSAPGGVLRITKELVAKLVANFQRGLRDTVPVPLGHDADALSSAGQVVALEQTSEGLDAIYDVADADTAERIAKGLITGTSALIRMDYEDAESGAGYGPVLIHAALTNAPYIKGLRPFEAVALGEKQAVVIPLTDDAGGDAAMKEKLLQLLAGIKDVSDDDLRDALKEHRPELFAVSNTGAPAAEAIEAAKAEGIVAGKQEVLAALSEAGIEVKLSESKGKETPKPEINLAEHPQFVALSEELRAERAERMKEKAEAAVDAAIKVGKALPKQREGLLTVALGENGLDTLQKLLPDKPIVEPGKEIGASTTEETGVALSEEAAAAEAARYLKVYAGQGGETK
jgi:hypothetical protein